MIYTVKLKQLRESKNIFSSYNKLVRSIQGLEFTKSDNEKPAFIRFKHTEPVSIEYILNSNGLDDALWAFRYVKNNDRDIRLFAVWCARQAQHLMKDEKSIFALDVIERHANGMSTDEEMSAAIDAAIDAARDAARDAAIGAASAASAANAASAADGGAARDAQKEMFIKMCRGQAPWQIKSSTTGDIDDV